MKREPPAQSLPASPEATFSCNRQHDHMRTGTSTRTGADAAISPQECRDSEKGHMF